MGEADYRLRGDLSNSFSALAVSGRQNGSDNQANRKLGEEDDDLQEIEEQEQEREREIIQLRKHLAEYAVKEEQIQNEKHILQRRIASMHKAFDQQQYDLIEATSKAISYRQEIIEENVHLRYALEAAQEERSIFISSLMPILSEVSLHPATLDAYSIVSNLRILFKHSKERLSIVEEKLRESQYQPIVLHSQRQELSFDDSSRPGLAHSNSNFSPSLEAVYTGVERQSNWNQNQSSLAPSPETVHMGVERRSNWSQPNVDRSPETIHMGVEGQGNWNHSSFSPSPETVHMGVERQNNGENVVGPHYLPSILEEASTSSHLEAEDSEEDDNGSGDYDDEDTNKPLPSIKGLQILGEAFPGNEIQASGYSTNGTTHCGFEWVCHLEDGSVKYIEGAKQPNYIVTADDVDTYLAVEVQPLDDRQRKGELVKCYANDHRKIVCHPDMIREIEKTLSVGHASYKLFVWEVSLDTWEPGILEIKKSSYSIRLNAPNGSVVVDEKYAPTTDVSLPAEIPLEFSILSPGGDERYLRTDYSSTDVSCSRDTIVLTMRLFIKRAVDRKLGKKKRRVLFFK